MKKTLLIVDDDSAAIKFFTESVASLNLETLVAKSAAELKAIQAPKIDAATVDYGFDKGFDGNDVANYLQQQYGQIPKAGITGGDPTDFTENLFDIRTRKGMSQESYASLVKALLYEKDPAKAWNPRAVSSKFYQEICAVYILLQGYTTATQIKQGKNPIPGFTLPNKTQAQINQVLDLESIGLFPKSFYTAVAALNPALGEDKIAEKFFETIANKDYDKLILNEVQHVEKQFRQLAERLS